MVLVGLHSLLSHCPLTLLIYPNHSGPAPLLNPTSPHHLHNHRRRRQPCLIYLRILSVCIRTGTSDSVCVGC